MHMLNGIKDLGEFSVILLATVAPSSMSLYDNAQRRKVGIYLCNSIIREKFFPEGLVIALSLHWITCLCLGCKQSLESI